MPLLFNTVVKFQPRHSDKKRKKRHPGCKGRSKTISIFRWHDLVNRKSKESTHKKLELINKFSKDAGYKMNIQKSIVCALCNEHFKNVIKKIISFTLQSKRIKQII